MKVAVMGGGPAGLAAALRAHSLGADVTLLERDQLGGVCYNEGPVPVRTLARAARMMRDASAWPAFGLVGKPPTIDARAALETARRAARYIHDDKRIDEMLRAEGVEVIQGVGDVRFVDPHTLAISEGRLISADRVIIAVGGHDRRLSIPGAELGLSYRDVLDLQALPARIVVIGGAATGCQLASIFADFGAHVSLVEAAPRLIPKDDVDLGEALGKAFVGHDIEVRTGARTERLERLGDGVRVHIQHDGEPEQIDADAVFFAVGWPANLEGLALGAAGVEVTTRGYVGVDAQLRTSQAHIFAVGDANGIAKLAQTAAHQGRLAAENAVLGLEQRYDSSVVPHGSFTDPEYASVGLTEQEARARCDCVVARYDYTLLSRAVIDGRVEGFCKLIADRGTGRVIGAHVLGEYSAEVIQVLAPCMVAKMNVLEIADLQLAYPTFTQAIGLAALQLAHQLGLRAGRLASDSVEMNERLH